MVWHGWHRGQDDEVGGMSGTFWGKIVSRLDLLDADSVQSMVQRLAPEHGLLETVLRSLREGVPANVAGAADFGAMGCVGNRWIPMSGGDACWAGMRPR